MLLLFLAWLFLLLISIQTWYFSCLLLLFIYFFCWSWSFLFYIWCIQIKKLFIVSLKLETFNVFLDHKLVFLINFFKLYIKTKTSVRIFLKTRTAKIIPLCKLFFCGVGGRWYRHLNLLFISNGGRWPWTLRDGGGGGDRIKELLHFPTMETKQRLSGPFSAPPL